MSRMYLTPAHTSLRAVTSIYGRLVNRTILLNGRPGLFVKRFMTSEENIISVCRQKIKDLLKPVKLEVSSSNDDPNGSHIQVLCISDEFTGKSTLQRQRLVYKAIWEELNGPVHAVDSIVAKTPKEAGMV